MNELNPTVREQEIYEEMELTPEMVKSMQTTRSCSHAADKKENSPRQAGRVPFYAGGGGRTHTCY